jgi:signal transduction histidine kinase
MPHLPHPTQPPQVPKDCFGCADRRAASDVMIEAAAVLDSLHMHVALLDATGVIVAVNGAWRDFGLANGATLQQANSVGSNYLDACHRADGPPPDATALAARAGIAAVLSGELPQFELEYPCHAPTAERWFLMRVTPLVGPRNGAVVTHDDITARWQLQVQHTALIAELLAANRELTDFAYVVSHDLKAPLRGISSLASWLVTDFSEKLGPEGREHLELITTRVKRLSGLIDAILAYSRAGRSRDERTPVALDPLLRNTIDLLAPPPHIEVTVLHELPLLNIEAVKIQQVFQNLLSNAIDFMDKPVGRIAIDCAREGADWHFSVADNGPGIEPRHFERIFQLFQTLASRDTLERTGVGLALVKKIIELEGGKIWVESKVGAGATFHFTIPVPTDHRQA